MLGCGVVWPRGLDFLYQRFSSLLDDEACQFRNQQSRTALKFGDHSSIRDSWPIAFSGCPRGPRVACETRCPKHAGPNLPAETRSRTRVSREPDGHRQRRSPGWSGLDQRHSNCLWFQMLGVEAHSLLPYDQYDRGNLSCQGQTRHLRPQALGQQSGVELLKRTGFAGGHDRRSLKQILQIVIAVSVQSADGALFLHSFELPVNTTVISAALCLDAKSAVRPQLPLGAETMRSLQDAKQHGGPDRTDRGDLAEQFPRLVFLALRQQLPPHFLTHRSQRIELLVIKLGPPAHSRFTDLPKPLDTMARCIHLLAGTRNGP